MKSRQANSIVVLFLLLFVFGRQLTLVLHFEHPEEAHCKVHRVKGPVKNFHFHSGKAIECDLCELLAHNSLDLNFPEITGLVYLVYGDCIQHIQWTESGKKQVLNVLKLRGPPFEVGNLK